ncbi:MAG TPA: VWA domain-containing protein [Sneathiellales bacterium]|nr:VWA domain-containing protein [Sneathiellales bacterium]
MDRTLGEFVTVLRKIGVEVSAAETIDAANTMDLIGYDDRRVLKMSLAMVLSKTEDERALFDDCFERFFSFYKFSDGHGEEGEIEEGGHSAQVGDPQPAEGEGGPAGGSGGGGMGQESEGGEGSTALRDLLLNRDQTALSMAMAQAARAVGVNQIVLFTQRGMYTRRIVEEMGLDAFDQEISELRRQDEEDAEAAALLRRLEAARRFLFEEVRDFVEENIALHANAVGKEFRREFLKKAKLTNIERRHFDDMRVLVRKMSKRLNAMYSRRRKVSKRGQLDVRRTLRGGLATDGVLFDTHWKSVKVDRPKVFVICDVSGSVAAVARFLLMFLYSLSETLPKVRSFAFSGQMGEISDLMELLTLEEAIPLVLEQYGGMPTDYGRSLMDFRDLAINDIDNRATVIILGDARSNYGDPRADILRDVYRRARQVIWLNPEGKSLWTTGDAEMASFAPYCTHAFVCNSLATLERVISKMLRAAM